MTNLKFDWHEKTILIVEDDLYNSKFLEAALKKTNANLLLAFDGTNAIEIVENTPQIDIALMDIRLPDMNGYEITRKLKAINPDLIVIAQTAYATDDDKRRCLDAGCVDFITKPINQVALLQMIYKYL